MAASASAQIISKPPDLQKSKRSDNGQVNNKSDYDGLPLKKTQSMLNNVSGLSKSKNAEVLNFLGATSTDTVNKMDDVLEDKSLSLTLRVRTVF